MKKITVYVLVFFLLLGLAGCKSKKSLFEENWEAIKDYYTSNYVMDEISTGIISTPNANKENSGMLLNLDSRSFKIFMTDVVPSNTGVGTMQVTSEFIYYFESGKAELYVDTKHSQFNVITDKAVMFISDNDFTFDGQNHVRTDRRTKLSTFIQLVRDDIRGATGYRLEDFIK